MTKRHTFILAAIALVGVILLAIFGVLGKSEVMAAIGSIMAAGGIIGTARGPAVRKDPQPADPSPPSDRSGFARLHLLAVLAGLAFYLLTVSGCGHIAGAYQGDERGAIMAGTRGAQAALRFTDEIIMVAVRDSPAKKEALAALAALRAGLDSYEARLIALLDDPQALNRAPGPDQ